MHHLKLIPVSLFAIINFSQAGTYSSHLRLLVCNNKYEQKCEQIFLANLKNINPTNIILGFQYAFGHKMILNNYIQTI